MWRNRFHSFSLFSIEAKVCEGKNVSPPETVKFLIIDICIIQVNCKAYSLGRNRSWKVDGSNGKFGTGISVTERDRNSEQRTPR